MQEGPQYVHTTVSQGTKNLNKSDNNCETSMRKLKFLKKSSLNSKDFLMHSSQVSWTHFDQAISWTKNPYKKFISSFCQI